MIGHFNHVAELDGIWWNIAEFGGIWQNSAELKGTWQNLAEFGRRRAQALLKTKYSQCLNEVVYN